MMVYSNSAGTSNNLDLYERDWEDVETVPYSALVAMFEKVGSTTKRLEILMHVSTFLRVVITKAPSNLLPVVYLCINRLCPDYEGLELGIGESLLMKAIAESTGSSLKDIKAQMDKVGDLGSVAQRKRNKQPTMFKQKRLTVPFVFKSLKEIATVSGSSSQSKKIGIITKLLSACEGSEAKFLIRSLEGKLRIQLAEKTVLTAVAHAIVQARADRKRNVISAESLADADNIVKGVYSEIPSYDIIVPALLQYGPKKLRDHCKLSPGIPLKPMLAKPTKSISEVLDRFENQEFTCEYKYDGERAQIHLLPDGSVRIYSRNSEDMSQRYPDLISQVPKAITSDTKSFVIDCECCAWDLREKRLLPFQVLSTRKRKDVQVEDIKIKVHLFAFDLLYLNERPLLHISLAERRHLLHESFTPVEGEFAFAKAHDLHNIDEITEFLEQAVKDSCEGLMVKMLKGSDSFYEPSRRSQNWLKIKKDYLAGIGDSLDLVVVGAFHGRGKRTAVYGAYLLACYDADSQEYQTICKIGTGFSEADLEKFYSDFQPYVIERKKSYYAHPEKGEQPSVWFEPATVWEVLTADLSLSPKYQAASGEMANGKGVSLRFPRYVRTREDKKPEQATSSSQVISLPPPKHNR